LVGLGNEAIDGDDMALTPRPRAGKPAPATQMPQQDGGVTRRTAIASIAAAVHATQAQASPLPPRIGDTNDAFDWSISEGQPIGTLAGQTTQLAIGATGLTARVDPDLPPGHTLAQVGSSWGISVSPDAPSYIDIQREWTITVMPPQMAVARNLRYPLVWWGHDQPTTDWYNRPGGLSRIKYITDTESPYPCHDGDVIEISPGYITRSASDHWVMDGKGAVLFANGNLHIKNIDGMGRWSLYPPDVTQPEIHYNSGAIAILRPDVIKTLGYGRPANGRCKVIIEGFDFDAWGSQVSGVRAYQNRSSLWPNPGSWDDFHISVTLRNFKIGRRPYLRGASGISGAAENWFVENGHLYDLGNGGMEHNAYISGRNLIMRGVRSARTRHNAPPPYRWQEDNKKLDGHALKLGFDNALVEGCAIDCSPGGDQAVSIQFYQGGNAVVRGCLLTVGPQTNSERGIIQYCVESNQRSWHYGGEGHSLVVENNVFVSHYGKPPIYMFPRGNVLGGEWRVYGMRQFTVRNNIAMVDRTKRYDNNLGPYKGPFIANPPARALGDAFDVPAWDADNLSVPFDASEAFFKERELLRYLRAAGPLVGSARVDTYRFKYPHGFEPRSDKFMGLG
jgi:hypothetical protein